jgi:hypothetical protein
MVRRPDLVLDCRSGGPGGRRRQIWVLCHTAGARSRPHSDGGAANPRASPAPVASQIVYAFAPRLPSTIAIYLTVRNVIVAADV